MGIYSSSLSYSDGLSKAQLHEKVDSPLDVQVGGSSHGITEYVYRLHASRLKVLIAASKKHSIDRKAADLEALRIIEKYSYCEDSTKPHDEEISMPIRERIWLVLADIVEGLAWCRREQSYFHRSLYRHTQALLWAPIFNDPDGAVEEGSVASVSAAKSYKIRGLNSSSCAQSAEVIISSLFDKKR